MLVDQWKKKAELYRTNALLIPLGDDFRFSQSTEWDVQRVNYEALFDHINSEHRHFVEAKFGTLQQYFDAVHQEQRELKREFPTLSGDFFTYADRSDNYWSGYYTSRPYYKRLDRVLLHYVRAAEMLYAWRMWDPAAKFDEMLQNARRELSLFQHHDGITGTAKTHVVNDYARRMLSAVTTCQFVMQQAVYRLLTKPSVCNKKLKTISYILLNIIIHFCIARFIYQTINSIISTWTTLVGPALATVAARLSWAMNCRLSTLFYIIHWLVGAKN